MLPLATSAAELRSAGVWGNSGEQGASLVRFAAKPASGMGVVYDSTGSLWDRGGAGVLNRYSPDGRQLATYRIPGQAGGYDRVTLFGETLMLKLGEKLYTLAITDPPDIEPSPMEVPASRLSSGIHAGWAAAANGREVFLVNPSGDTQVVAESPTDVQFLEIGPDGGVYVMFQGKLTRVDAAAPEGARGPWASPGDCPTWLNGFWYGFNWHGTIRRFSAALNPDPGVVLGGASGSFIGYVEGNHELENGRGLAHLGGDLFAASGKEGVLHLLEWNEVDKRFKIIRRIGSIPNCTALALDGKGRVWYSTGIWEWNEGPDAPLRHSVPLADAPGPFGASVLPNGSMVAPVFRNGKPCVLTGPLGEPVKVRGGVGALNKDSLTSAVVNWDKQTALVVINPSGKGDAFAINTNGEGQSKIGEVFLQTNPPVAQWTSLVGVGDQLIGAADGFVIELTRDGANWNESRRWNSWGTKPDQKFGSEIYVASHQKRLWVSDTTRQRVICFDLESSAPIGSLGTIDQPGNNLSTFNAPKILAVNGSRGVVFDSGNQRLVKLEITP